MNDLAQWKVHAEPGQMTYEINGIDVSGQVQRGAIILDRERIPTLQVELTGGGTLEGEGIVRVLTDEADDEAAARKAILGWLHQLNPGEVERRITAGPMSSGVGSAVVEALIAMADPS